MAFLKNIFGRSGKKEKREYPFIKMNQDPEACWEIIGELGDGAFGKVYKAKHRESGKVAAAKIVELSCEEDLEDFAVEIDILVECAASKYVIEMHEAYLFKDKLWMLIEYCAGGAMDDVLQELDRGLNEAQMKVVTRHLFEALSALHEKNIIHRDLKAGNLLLCSDGMVKLADFGVSALNKSPDQKRDSFIGTPFWMAPEVIACETNKDVPYGRPADIWSAGVTMIELADMNPPNHEMHPMRVLFKIPKADPPTVEKPSAWSPEFNDFVSKCLHKEPENRPTAQEMLNHPFLKDSDRTTPMKVVFAEVRAEIQETIQELGDAHGDNLSQDGDGEAPGNTSVVSMDDNNGLQLQKSSGVEESEKEDTLGERQNFKTLRRVRKFSVDGEDYTTSTEVIIDVNRGKNVEQQGQRLMQEQRKLEVREMKVLQRLELKDTQTLFQLIQKDKEEQEKRFDAQRQDLERRFDGQLDVLAKLQKKEIERFEKKQRDDFVLRAKLLKTQQVETTKRFKKEQKSKEKMDEKNASAAVDLKSMSKAEKKSDFKKWKDEYAQKLIQQESDHEAKLVDEFYKKCATWKKECRNALRDMEGDCLLKRHELIQVREIDFWELERVHFQDHYQLSRNQLSEAFELQRHQMKERHKKEADQHIRRTGIRKDILIRRHLVEIKTVPTNLKKQKLAAMNALRKQLRKKGVSKQEEKETLRLCEKNINEKNSAELAKVQEDHKTAMEEHVTSSEQALAEIQSLQQRKLDQLQEREDEKLANHDQNYHAQVKEYNSRLTARKKELTRDFATQRKNLALFYDSSTPLVSKSKSLMSLNV